jgi:hypothetical protein
MKKIERDGTQRPHKNRKNNIAKIKNRAPQIFFAETNK